MSNAMQIINKQLLRGLALRIAEAAEPIGAGMDVIESTLNRYGYTFTKNEILTACLYLEGKGLVRMEHAGNEALNISRDIAHIKPDGIDVLEGTKKVDGITLGD